MQDHEPLVPLQPALSQQIQEQANEAANALAKSSLGKNDDPNLLEVRPGPGHPQYV